MWIVEIIVKLIKIVVIGEYGHFCHLGHELYAFDGRLAIIGDNETVVNWKCKIYQYWLVNFTIEYYQNQKHIYF